MGFWGKLGKGLLKVAPYAAMAIPGIGPVASMAIQAGLGAANAKASGAGWKGVLGGAAAGAITSKVGGLGPSAGTAAKGAAQAAGQTAAKATVKGTLGKIAKNIGTNVAMNVAGGLSNQSNQSSSPMMNQINQSQGRAPSQQSSQMTGRASGLGPDMSNPNLANFLQMGQQQAIRNQPFRAGYDVHSQGPEPVNDAMGNVGAPVVTRMPPIFSGGRKRQQQQAY